MINKVSSDGKQKIQNKKVANRIIVNGRSSYFITLKDHKQLKKKQTIPEFAYKIQPK